MQDGKFGLSNNPKRAASDEWNGNASFTACNQPKRRAAVLKDVTNIFCDNGYRNCLNASKIPSKRKEGREGPAIVFKIGPSVQNVVVSVEEEFQSPLPPLAKVVSLKNLDENQSCNSNEIGMKDRCEDKMLNSQDSGNLSQCQDISKEECFTDIDANHSDPQLCSLYASDIYGNLHLAEVNRRPNHNYMETVQNDITLIMRAKLVDWLVEVCYEYKLQPETLHLTVYLMDMFLSRECIPRQRLQLLGVTCLVIAWKFEERSKPCVEELCFIIDCIHTKHEVIQLESQVLNSLGFQIAVPTARTFLRRFLRAAQFSYETTEDSNLELGFLAEYLTELTLVDYGFLEIRPSAIAASAVFLARWTLERSGHPWNATLRYYTKYKATDLKSTVHSLQWLQLGSGSSSLRILYAKYNQDKYKQVAALVSPALPDTLFGT